MNVPEKPSTGWTRVPLESIADIASGVGFPLEMQGKDAGDLPVFKVGDISEAWKEGRTKLGRAKHYVSAEQGRSLGGKPLPAGTVVFAKIGAAIALNRRAVLAQASLVDNNVMGLIPKEERVDPAYLYYLACTLRFGEMSRATTVPSIRRSDVAGLHVPLAPRSEQAGIVGEIEKHLTRLARGVEAVEQVKSHLRRYRASTLAAAFAGRLVERQATQGETGHQCLARILEERRIAFAEAFPGKRYQSPPPADLSGLPPIPKDWAWATAEQLSDATRSITYGVIKLGDPVPDGVPTLRSSDVRHLHIDLTGVKRISPAIAQNYKRTFLVGGEILFTVRGTLGGIVVAPDSCKGFNVSREVAVVALVNPSVGPCTAIFAGSPWTQAWLTRNAKGIAYTGINIETLKQMPVPVPPPEEQSRIVLEVERHMSLTDQTQTLIQVCQRRSSRLRDRILSSAFDGSLSPVEA